MTDLEQAAQAVLVAAQAVLVRWDSPAWDWAHQGPTAALMADLRRALAAHKEQAELVQAEPVQAEPVGLLSVRYHRGCASMANADFDYFGDLPEGNYSLCVVAPQQAEPVRMNDPTPPFPLHSSATKQQAEQAVEPPQRRSLTDEERQAMWQASDFRGNGGQRDWFIEGIRAAEVAHGITAKQSEPVAIPGAIPMSEVAARSRSMPERSKALESARERGLEIARSLNIEEPPAADAFFAAPADPVVERAALFNELGEQMFPTVKLSGCAVCGIGAGKVMGYVCPRNLCPMKITCGGAV
jgi:hypothetical protein